MRITSRIYLTFAVLVAAAGALAASSKGSAQEPLAARWQVDLATLRAKLSEMHPNPFRRTDKATFDAGVEALDRNLPGATREQAIVGIMRLVAMLGDGHTSVLPGPQRRAGFHVLPLRFYLYGDDLVLDGADRAYASALGAKLAAINGIPASEVIRRVREVTPGDNSSSVNSRLPSYVVVPEVLAGLGIITSPSSPIQISVDQAGTPRTIAVSPVPPPESHVAPGIATTYSANWMDRAPAMGPLWLKNAGKPYWFTYLPKERALYLQYNAATSDPAEPMAQFANRLTTAIEQRQPRRVVVDLRLNPGGNGYWNRLLVRALLRSAAAGRKGQFFVLIGRQTFSAGSAMAVELEKYAAVTFMGEASGGSVQGFGDHQPVFLPNTRLTVMVATKFYQNDGPNDDRPAVVPQVLVPLTPKDYGAGVDPVMNAAIRFGS